MTTSADQPTVWVVGDAMLDVTVSSPQFRRTPENSQVPVIPTADLESAQIAPGGAANLAANLAALGVRVRLFGRIGANDEAGYALGRLLSRLNVDNHLLSSTSVTTTRTRYYESGRLLVRQDADAVCGPVFPEQVQYPIPSAIALTDYGRDVLTRQSCQRWAEFAHRHGVPLFIDPKVEREDVWSGLRGIVLVANWTEAVDLVARLNAHEWRDFDSDDTAEDLVALVRRRVPTSSIVVKRGTSGSTIATTDGAIHHIPAVHPQRLFDVQGAGDTYLAGLIVARIRGAEWADAGLYASAAAGVAVGKPGTVIVSAAEVRKQIIAHTGHSRGVIDADAAYALSARLRALDLTVGYASGCWDLRLHTGHLQLLAEAQLECDFLFVGVDSDRRVHTLKGPGRPVLLQHERALQVASIQGVGAAFVFDSPAVYPTDVIAALKPALFVKGGDYRSAPVPEAESLSTWGGRLMLVDTVPGNSTTATLHHINETTGGPTRGEDHRIRDGGLAQPGGGDRTQLEDGS